MWHKKHRQDDPQAPPGKRLKENLTDLYASGEIAGERAQSLLDDAGDFARSLGSSDMQDLRGKRTAGSSKNKDRDLRRRLLKRSHWPPMYVAEVRCYSRKEKEVAPRRVALLLPHEVVGVLAETGDPNIICAHAALDPWNEERHAQIERGLGAPFMSISLWGDGVPFSWDRSKSADMWVMSFPGLQEKSQRDIRIVVTALPHEWVVKETQDDLMSILAWSFQCLSEGRYPHCRHNSEPFKDDESWRKKRSNEKLQLAALIELKGDWKQLHSCFGVPYWRRAPEKPICWRCTCSKNTLTTETGAGWCTPLYKGCSPN